MDQFCCVCISLMSYGLRITWQDVNGAVQLQQHTNMESVNRMLAAGLTVQQCTDNNFWVIGLFGDTTLYGTRVCAQHAHAETLRIMEQAWSAR